MSSYPHSGYAALGEIEISVNLLEDAKKHADIEILSEPYDLQFDSEGNLVQ